VGALVQPGVGILAPPGKRPARTRPVKRDWRATPSSRTCDLCCGRDTVEIRLKNLGVTNKTSPNDPHSIHLHGLDVNAANDGCPRPRWAPSRLTQPWRAPQRDRLLLYTMHAGTYMYTATRRRYHVQMACLERSWSTIHGWGVLNGGPARVAAR